MMLMLDLCAGLGGASAAMRDRGWEVITVDNDARFNCTITTDVRFWSWDGPRPDLIWASPPCVEFAREFMPWSKTGKTPDMSIVDACFRIVQETGPRYWVIENVKGALSWIGPALGRPAYICNPYYLWGWFPDISHVYVKSDKEKLSSSQAARRAMIPYTLSLGMAYAIEMQGELMPQEVK